MVLASLSIRALARAMMPMAVSRGLSARAFRRQLTSQFGASYRWTTLLGDYREFRGMIRFESAVRSLLPGTKPSPNIMTDVDLRRERRFRGIGNATYENVETGEQYEQVISMYSDTFDSKQAYTDMYLADKEKSKYLPEWSVVKIEWFAIQHKEGWSW